MADSDIFSSAQYVSSRRAYVLQCAFEYFVALFSADAYLAKLLKYLGLSDAATGIISSLITFTLLFQLFSVVLGQRLKKVKSTVITLDTLSQVFFALTFFTPFLPFSSSGRAFCAVLLLFSAYLTLYLNNTITYKWGNSFVSPDNRASFGAGKEMISLISGIAVTLIAGLAVDCFENSGHLPRAFVFLGAATLAASVCNFFCLLKMKELPLNGSKETDKEKFSVIARAVLKNRNYRNVIILTTLIEIAKNTTNGFMGTYKTVDLGLSVGKIQFINVFACLTRFFVSKPFGRFSDKYGYSRGYFVGIILTIATYVSGIFASGSLRWLIIPFTALLQISYAGTSQNTYSMAYSYVEEEYILPAMSVCNSIRGTAGFAASFLAGLFVDYVQKNGNMLFGIHASAQQLLCVISSVICVFALIFEKKYLMNSSVKDNKL